ncbi:MAG TPA: thiamine-phosphate kinase [Candidatus Dormibacteraeota bacterium]|jgi:thiamine-monophosphate kinase|nr:thiamine-phosphate kinase [Candidatus Dormibacteraeota bacterium]
MPLSSTTATQRRFGAGGPTLAEVGERVLLDRLLEIAEEAAGAPHHGLSGDDAAVWTPPPGRDLATSVDALVEGVDFRRAWITPRQLGARAFAVAVSDLAGTGATPVHCLATLCAPGSEVLDDILDIQRGLCAAAAALGCAVAGGDVSAIDGPMVIDVCVTGSVARGRALRRSAGRPGDVLLVTGVLGRAAAGLRLLLEGRPPQTALEKGWIDAQLQPPLRVAEGRRLADAGVRCGGDISDGLLLDAARTARACGCAIELWAEKLPVDAQLAERFGPRWLELAIGGGEDFELLVAVDEADAGRLAGEWPADLAPLREVGRLRSGTGVRLLDRRDGTEMPQPQTAAEHFA